MVDIGYGTKCGRPSEQIQIGPSSLARRWYTLQNGDYRPMNYTVLAAGIVAVPIFFSLAGRFIGLSVIAIWSAATAYFFMPPQHSFRISHAGDLVALALFGAVGLVFAKTVPRRKQPVPDQPEVPERTPPPTALVDLEAVLVDLMSSSDLGDRLRQRQIEVAPCLPRFRCPYVDAAHILSQVLTIVMGDTQLRRVSFDVCRRPGVSLLFVTGLRASPLPLQQMIAIGRGAENCERADFPWPSGVQATWFDNGYGRVFQIAVPEVMPAAG